MFFESVFFLDLWIYLSYFYLCIHSLDYEYGCIRQMREKLGWSLHHPLKSTLKLPGSLSSLDMAVTRFAEAEAWPSLFVGLEG